MLDFNASILGHRELLGRHFLTILKDAFLLESALILARPKH